MSTLFSNCTQRGRVFCDHASRFFRRSVRCEPNVNGRQMFDLLLLLYNKRFEVIKGSCCLELFLESFMKFLDCGP